MTDIDIVLRALNAQPTPNMPDIVAGDSLIERQHHLHSAIKAKLADNPSASDMVDRYSENPSVWFGLLADALQDNRVLDDGEVLSAARSVLTLTDSADPERIDEKLSDEQVSNLVLGQAPDFDGIVQE